MEVLGIDIGGSGIKGGIVNTKTGEMISARFRVDTPIPAKAPAVAKAIGEVAKHFEWKGKIGAGFPGVVRRSIVNTAANLHPKSWTGVNVDQLLSHQTGCQVKVINDADAAGLAEMKFGAGIGHEKEIVLMLTFGTGIGSAIFVEGHLLPNVEFGHLQMHGKDAEKRASAAVKDNKDLSYHEWGVRVNEYMQHVEHLIYPDLFIIGGGVSNDFHKFADCIHVEAKVVPAKFLNNAGIIGAAVEASGE